MKKSKILMLLPAFLLVGCAKSINKEDAVAKAQQINEYQAQHPVTEFKFEMYSLEQEDNEKEEQRASYEFSEEKVYFHIKAEETEVYAYKQDSKYYVVNAIAKQYYEYGEEAKASFDTLITGQKTQISQMFTGMARVDVEGLLTKYVPMPNANVKYSTKGDGSLIVEASYKGSEGGATGELSAKVAWDKYYPTEMSVKSTASEEGHSYKMEMSVKFEYSVSPSFVDLSSGYSKIN